MISTAQLTLIFPHAGSRLSRFVQPLNDAMAQFDIATPRRMAAFLAQVAHESTELINLRERASGEAYEGRVDLGNAYAGDGPRYRAGGPIGVTGRFNYRNGGIAIGVDLEADPERVEEPEVGCKLSAWFWQQHDLNELADRNTFAAFGAITYRINGGYNGLDQRLDYWFLSLEAFGLITVNNRRVP